MDGTAAINNNLEALKRILAGLFVMAGFGSHPEARADPELVEGAPRRTLPRRLRLAILRLLRPAESAARRLIIAAARGLVIAPPPPPSAARKRGRIKVVPAVPSLILPCAAGDHAQRGGGFAPPSPRFITLPLFDRLRRAGLRPPASRGSPRICVPGWTERLPVPIRLAPSPEDPIDATRLSQRLAALAAALDDLPDQARRFARWKARRDALIPPCEAGEVSRRDGGGTADAKKTPGRIRRTSPLRPGRPPGGRLTRFDPSAKRGSTIREVDEILAHAHALALYALQYPDTS